MGEGYLKLTRIGKTTRSCLLLLIALLALCCTGCGISDYAQTQSRELEILISEDALQYLEEEQKLTEENTPDASIGQDEDSFLSDDASRFYYQHLDATKQLWYADIEAALGTMTEEASLSKAGLEGGLTEEDINRIFSAVLADHPEIFYVSGYHYTKHTLGEEILSIEFTGKYEMDRDSALTRKEQLEDAAKEWLSIVPADASDYEKIKFVYESIIENTDYVLGSVDNQNIASVLLNHASVCQGYAQTAQYLLNRLGVECTLIQGTDDTGEAHAWNLVKADGAYYLMDVTWGDASYVTDGTFNGSEGRPEIRYDYLLVTSAQMASTHFAEELVTLPVCTATQDNYYVREGAYFTSYDREQMKALFDKRFAEGERDVSFACSDEAVYQTIFSAFLDDQEIFDYLPEEYKRIAYSENPDFGSMTFWVTNE